MRVFKWKNWNLILVNTEQEETCRFTIGHLLALHSVTALSGMYQDWFLDYASYVILERAVPHLAGWSETCAEAYPSFNEKDG